MDNSSEPLKRYALRWFALSLAAWFATLPFIVAGAICAIPAMTGLALAAQVAIVGLALTKLVEFRFLWLGVFYNPRAQTISALPGVAALATAIVIIAATIYS